MNESSSDSEDSSDSSEYKYITMYDPLARKNSSFITNNQKQSFVSTHQTPVKLLTNLSGSSQSDGGNYVLDHMIQSDPKADKPPKASHQRHREKPVIK